MQTSAYSKPVICEIKYGEDSISADMNEQKLESVEKANNQQHCYKIGSEHNSYGEAIANKPIFACCISNKAL